MSQRQSQSIVRGRTGWKQLQTIVQQETYDQVALLVDERTYHHCLPVLYRAVPELRKAPVIEIPGGEGYKNLDTCREVWEQLLENAMTRYSLLVNLGGGVLTDIGGFCAATFKRGIDFIHIPTTVMGQADAAIGGKTGVNVAGYKNQVGEFAFPAKIIIEPAFLTTLPDRQIRNGCAELLKHALIAAPQLFQHLSRYFQQQWSTEDEQFGNFLEQSATIKQDIVDTDPYEQKERQMLNFGHTLGHAIESVSQQQNRNILHGEAVLCGMLMEAQLSAEIYGWKKKEWQQVTEAIQALQYDIPLPPLTKELLEPALQQDKKNREGQLLFTLLPEIGQADVEQTVPEHLLRQVIEDFSHYYAV